MRRDPRRDERGYSMAELVVTMLVGGLVLAALGTVVLSLTRGASTLNTTNRSSAGVRLALEEMSRMLRVAYRPPGESSAIVLAKANKLSFYGLVDHTNGGTPPPPVLITYDFDPNYVFDGAKGCLTETRTAGRQLSAVSPTGSLYAWDATPTVTCLFPTPTAPAFSYAASGALTASGGDPTPLTVPVNGALSSLDCQRVQSVGVQLSGPPPVDGAAVTVSTRVTLQNVVAEAGTW